jgi:hypothetical protein
MLCMKSMITGSIAIGKVIRRSDSPMAFNSSGHLSHATEPAAVSRTHSFAVLPGGNPMIGVPTRPSLDFE